MAFQDGNEVTEVTKVTTLAGLGQLVGGKNKYIIHGEYDNDSLIETTVTIEAGSDAPIDSAAVPGSETQPSGVNTDDINNIEADIIAAKIRHAGEQAKIAEMETVLEGIKRNMTANTKTDKKRIKLDRRIRKATKELKIAKDTLAAGKRRANGDSLIPPLIGDCIPRYKLAVKNRQAKLDKLIKKLDRRIAKTNPLRNEVAKSLVGANMFPTYDK